METSELIKKVRKIEIKTRGITKQLFSGEYHSAFKGRGMAFSEVREYFPGDDIRSIDWNVTARYAEPYVKVFEEERELTVVLLVDISASQSFGTQLQYKKDLVTELCAVLAFSAIQNNDKIGLILFSDIIEKFIPPKKGKTHALRIIRELLEFKPSGLKTDINLALRYLTNVLKKRSIVFVVSDFLTENYEASLKIAAKKHDTVAIQIYDKSEAELPKVGLIRVFDAETGKHQWVDTASKKYRENYNDWWDTNQKSLNIILNRNKVDLIKIRTDESYIAPLQNFFKKRENKR
ncbi:MAG: DUF58 domain-containing protein [Candidatus Kapabacteria bacterium]|nr:DUF58 domain-containing protein [Ignavibacteriota bacterium]MCW5883712.1 DUF58 domain-containing protein [Candidatus Kapabacteria bacterium]